MSVETVEKIILAACVVAFGWFIAFVWQVFTTFQTLNGHPLNPWKFFAVFVMGDLILAIIAYFATKGSLRGIEPASPVRTHPY